MADFLRASDSVVRLEKECDEANRKTVRSIFQQIEDDKLVYFEFARSIMASTNSLMKAASIIHDNIFENIGR